MRDRLRLPLSFDAAALERDAEGLTSWEPHFNAGNYSGEWSGVALRTNAGAETLYADPAATARPFEDTPALARCSGVRDALARLKTTFHGVRFLRLGAGARIHEHRDYGLGLDDSNEARLHIPVVSDPGVEFVLADTPVDMRPGELWYIDVNRYHEVTNASARPRIHLVIDAVANEWLRAQLASAEAAGGA